MKILFIVTAHNSLSQRAYVELTDRGHQVDIQLATSAEAMISAVNDLSPDLIIAPFLKAYVPDVIWKNHTCLIVHPGIKGDRGPSSLDWAITTEQEIWGVTILEASAEMDAGAIWSTQEFLMPIASKSAIYRKEVSNAAIKGILDAVAKFQQNNYTPEPLDYSQPDVRGQLLPSMKQTDRKLNWFDTTENIVRKIRAADSQPGVLDSINSQEYYLYGAHEEDALTGPAGEIIAKRDGAICRATGNGAVWITHLKKKSTNGSIYYKLPAEQILKDTLANVPTVQLSPFDAYVGRTYRDIFYEEKDEVGYLHFPFYNGAMSTEQCQRLTDTYIKACHRDTKVLVLKGGNDFWSNGIHLNVIEAANYPGHESWKNINAINDLVRQVITTDNKLVISVMQGNAAAGGVILALAADYVFAREGVVLNPHYKKMGLYGSEYWTYLLPKRVGSGLALRLTDDCLPISTHFAKNIGLIDDFYPDTVLASEIHSFARLLATQSDYEQLIINKKKRRNLDEQIKPLAQYRKEELKQMWNNFFAEDSKYHDLRRAFVYKLTCDTTSNYTTSNMSPMIKERLR
ncbi:hydrogenase maturation protein [Desulfuribacillus alkaliarsenatis]|uniref:Hydrogenase maturation protein n=1 Tax=Desulfuribacillus alkaliarsenatis TaxID=766136 RepID=A0A1E5G3A4_9FIRM|nr:hydrogenase maturation protein [Desulfuribacillus alkaliarsenatis]OEF97533.1 hydrogenase maturation protein [Desulfuribacillus alkaliarsenatis]